VRPRGEGGPKDSRTGTKSNQESNYIHTTTDLVSVSADDRGHPIEGRVHHHFAEKAARRGDKALGPGEIIEHDVAPECLKSSDDRATLRMQSKDGEIINDSARDKSEAKEQTNDVDKSLVVVVVVVDVNDAQCPTSRQFSTAKYGRSGV